MPGEQGSPRGLTGGPWPQCRVAAPADRRAWAAQWRVRINSKYSKFNSNASKLDEIQIGPSLTLKI
jgi:hypothetical protein